MANWVKFGNCFPINLDLIAKFDYGCQSTSIRFFTSSGSSSDWFCGNGDKCYEVGKWLEKCISKPSNKLRIYPND